MVDVPRLTYDLVSPKNSGKDGKVSTIGFPRLNHSQSLEFFRVNGWDILGHMNLMHDTTSDKNAAQLGTAHGGP